MLFSVILVDKETGYDSINKIHDSSFHILLIWSMEKCHNNIFHVKFYQILKIYFKYASDETMVNSIVKTNFLSDFADFIRNHILGWNYVNVIRDQFLWFFKDLIKMINSVKNVKPPKNFLKDYSEIFN